MKYLVLVYWLLLVSVLYTYFVYPLLIALLHSRLVRRDGLARSVSVVIAAFNEELVIVRRVREFLGVLAGPGMNGELIVVSDGSTDNTATAAVEAATSYPGVPFQVITLPEKSGKAVALSTGVSAAKHQFIVFADVRQTWAPDTLVLLLENFADPAVGAVSGELIVRAEGGVMEGVGLYWRYEKWIRHNESRIGSMAGATGAISAVRRELFQAPPPGTILDDVYWPLMVARRGFRVIHDERALAFDQLPSRPRDEFRRKVRTLSGNFQLLTRLPWVLLPWQNPVWIQFVSHKLLRLFVPWALLGILALSIFLHGRIYSAMLLGQVVFYAVGFIGLITPLGSLVRISGVIGSFMVLNAAAWVAFWTWIFGRTASSWGKVQYTAESGKPRAS